jgi:PilZ domain
LQPLVASGRIGGMAERRQAPREMKVFPCTLRRSKGRAIHCETIDVGPGGMAVASERPLAPDEVLVFDLPAVRGQARVLREQAYHVYALRFETLQAEARAGLERLVARS